MQIGSARLFQAGVDWKLVKEFTGHISDAVNKYQVTSNEQREALSVIIRGGKDDSKTVKCTPEIENPNLEVTVKDNYEGTMGKASCCCKPKSNCKKPKILVTWLTALLMLERVAKPQLK